MPLDEGPNPGFFSGSDQIIPADFDGDGRDDVLIFGRSGDVRDDGPLAAWQILRSTGAGRVEVRDLSDRGIEARTALAPMTRVMDVDGNGLPDLVYGAGTYLPTIPHLQPDADCFDLPEATWRVRLNNAGQLGPEIETHIRHGCHGGSIAFDIEGDGMQELLFAAAPDADYLSAMRFDGIGDGDAVGTCSTILPRPPGHGVRYWNPVGEWWRVTDYDGDGRNDLLRFALTDPRQLLLFRSTGALNFAAQFERTVVHQFEGTSYVYNPNRVEDHLALLRRSMVVDLRGDGTQDLVTTRMIQGPYRRVWGLATSSDGRTSTEITQVPGRTPGYLVGAARFVDTNADGRYEVLAAGQEFETEIREDLFGDEYEQPVLTGDLSVTLSDARPLRIRSFIQGSRRRVDVSYDRLRASERSTHTPAECGWPQNCQGLGRPVIAGYEIVGPQGTDVEVAYRYEGWRTDLRVGALGFAAIEATTTWRDEWPEWSRTEFDQEVLQVAGRWTTRALAPHHTIRIVGDAPVRRTESVSPRVPRVIDTSAGTYTWEQRTGTASAAEDWGQGQEELESRRVTRAFDEYGRVTFTTTEVAGFGDVFTTTSQSSYEPVDDRWLLHLLSERSSRSCQRLGGAPTECTPNWLTVHTYSGIGAPRTARSGPDGDGPTTTTFYDTRGNVVRVQATVEDSEPRNAWTRYDEEGVHVECVVNAEGHRTALAHERTTGAVTAARDPNGSEVHFTLDTWGRPVHTVSSTGAASTVEYRTVTEDGFAYTVVHEREASGEYRRTRLGVRGEVEAAWMNGADRLAVVRSTYDARGRMVSRSQPHFDGDPSADAVRVWYDRHGRVDGVYRAGAPFTEHQYYGNFVETWTGAAKRTVFSDVLGRPRRIVEADETTTIFHHDAGGQLVRTDGPGAADVDRIFDSYGRLDTLIDPDRGVRSWEYDGFGQVAAATDGNGVRTEYEYDRLGRTVLRTDPGGWARWTWDSGVGAVGQLSRTQTQEVTEDYAYTSLGQLDSYTLTGGGESFRYKYGYDDIGRLGRFEYPVHGNRVTALEHIYSDHGPLNEVRLEGAGVLWHAGQRDALGRVRTSVTGDISRTAEYDGPQLVRQRLERNLFDILDLEYGYDSDGLLDSRTDRTAWGDDDPARRVEWYGRDERFRLTAHKISRVQGDAESVVGEESFGYDPLGNLNFRSSQGTLEFTDPRPHAVSRIGNRDLEYDGNGAVVSDGVRTFDYGPQGLPKTIRFEGFPTVLSYTADSTRWRKVTVANQSVYAGGLFERRETAATSQGVFTVQVAGDTIAEITITDAGERSVHWIGTDRLGSPVLRAEEHGGPIERSTFGPFGEGAPVTAASTGYTNHEHDPSTGLVNMVFRQYDPALAQFSVPDPLLGDPYDTNRQNPYAYVGHRPLDFTDPLGLEQEGVGMTIPIDATEAMPLDAASAGWMYGQEAHIALYDAGVDGWVEGVSARKGARSAGTLVAGHESGGPAYPAANVWQHPPSALDWGVGTGCALAPGVPGCGFQVPSTDINFGRSLRSTYEPTRYDLANEHLGENGGMALGGLDALAGGGVAVGARAASTAAGAANLRTLLGALQYVGKGLRAGRHHLWPKALGNQIPYGHWSLTKLGSLAHGRAQWMLNRYLRTIKSSKTGRDMFPRRGNKGVDVRRSFDRVEVLRALRGFYKEFDNGAYYQAFLNEVRISRQINGKKWP